MDFIKQYLTKKKNKLIEDDFKFTYNKQNNKVAVIVEPRNHPFFDLVVYNVMNYLDNEWNLHIFSYDEEYVKSLFKGSTYRFTKLSQTNLNVNEYNSLFQSTLFWNTINEETILIFQTDSFILNPTVNIDNFLNYPFIGGIYKYIKNNSINLCGSPKMNFSINGGFSLRKKSVMIECIQKVNKEDIIEYRKKLNMNNEYYMNTNIIGEDTFFQNALDLLNYKLPKPVQCINFCSNLCFGGFNKNSLGIHNIKPIQVNICKKQIIEYLTSYNEEIKTIDLKKKNETEIVGRELIQDNKFTEDNNNNNLNYWYKKEGINIFPLQNRIEEIHKRLTINHGDIKGEDVEQMLCLKHIKGNEKILEIGGNIGRVSCILSTILDNEQNLVVLESNPKHSQELKENRDINNFKFQVEDSALSNRKLYQYGWNTFTEEEKNKYTLDVQNMMNKIKIINYNNFINKYNIQFDTLILDCEGAFYYIIQDFPEILNNITKIIIENDYPSYDRKLFVDNILINKGFTSIEKIPLAKRHWGYWLNQNIRDNFYEVWERKIGKKEIQKPKKIDCFTFYNELDMLEFRLNYLYNSVDYFVLVESTFTHKGNKKELYYKNNQKRFEKYQDKIIHIVVEDMPNTNNAWDNEKFQRKCIDRGLSKLNLTNNDIIIVSDLDEIIDRDTLSTITNVNGILNLQQDLYYYNIETKQKGKWNFAKILNYKTYCDYNKDCSVIRLLHFNYKLNCVNKGGWHFSYFGNIDFIKNKIENIVEGKTLWNSMNKCKLTANNINYRVKQGKDLYGRNTEFIKIKVKDNTYLPENYQKYNVFKNIENKIQKPFLKDLNKIFDKVYCINLDECKDRWVEFQKQINILGMKNKLVRISGLKPPKNYFLPNQIMSGQLGCTLSHIKMLGHALKHANGNILVFEDDIIVNKDTSKLIKDYMNSLPEEWAICYFGGQPLVKLSLYKQKSKYKIFNAKFIEGSYAYAVNYNYIKELFNHCLSCLINDKSNFTGIYDHALYNFINKTKSFICYPLMIKPSPGLSCITNKYNTETSNEQFIENYWKKCL